MKASLAAGIAGAKKIAVSVVAVQKRQETFAFTAHDGLDECGRGRHVRFVVDSAKTQERLAAKRAKAGIK